MKFPGKNYHRKESMPFMITNVSKKIICVKDIPSNMIEEAIFILKNDMTSHSQDDKIGKRRKEMIEGETNFFLNDYMKTIEMDKRKEKKKKFFRKKVTDIIFFTAFALITCILTLTIFMNELN